MTNKTGPVGIAFAVIAALSLTSMAFAGRELYERARADRTPPPPTKKLAPGAGSLASAGTLGSYAGLRVYSTSAAPPIYVDVDSDGVEDMIALLADTKLTPDVYVTALGGKSLAPLWIRGPYSTQPASPARLFRAGDRVVVARTFDTIENAHVLSLRTGGELQTFGVSEPLAGACGVADGSRRLKLASGKVLDLESGTMTTTPSSDACAYEWPRCDGKNRARCLSVESVAIKGEVVDPVTTYVEDDWQLSVGTLSSAHPLARPTIIALGATRGRVVWDEVLASIDTPEEHSVASVSVGSQRMLVLTQEPDMKVHVRALDAKTGDQVWQDSIEGTGLVAKSVHAGAQRVFVVLGGAREEVHVYEADKGTVVGTIADVSSDKASATPTGRYPGYYYGRGGSYPMPYVE